MKGLQTLVYENEEAVRVCLKYETNDYWFVVKTFKKDNTSYLKVSTIPIAEQEKDWRTQIKEYFSLADLRPAMEFINVCSFNMAEEKAVLEGETLLFRCPDGHRAFSAFKCRNFSGTLAIHAASSFKHKSIKIFGSNDVARIASYYDVEARNMPLGFADYMLSALDFAQTALGRLW